MFDWEKHTILKIARIATRVMGYGRVLMLYALGYEYPNAARDWKWQWFFLQARRWRNRNTVEQERHHLDESIIQRAVRGP